MNSHNIPTTAQAEPETHGTVGREHLERMLGDAIATKRVNKTGYVRPFGGLYPAQCDTVASHSHAVSALAVMLAYEVRGHLKELFGTDLSIEDVALMGILHDQGEGRSQDPGAISKAIGACDVHGMERRGLEVSVKGLRIEQRAMELYDDYRRYRTLTSVLVHMADTLEGIEKALHSAGRSQDILRIAKESAKECVEIYRHRPTESAETHYLVDRVLIPGLQILSEKYGLNLLTD